MVKLTETMIFQRTKKNDLKYVCELNCWGSDITDVSVVRQMPNLQVLSLSVNRISSLEDFACCMSLRDLYLRKNCIENLSELVHLQDLPNLQVLWLAENPCSRLPNYRERVLRYLPNLCKLDNIPVTSDEVCRACCSEQDLLRAEVHQRSASPTRHSRSPSPQQHHTSPSQQQTCQRKSNIVNAILCLINELDKNSLEIVDDAIRNRLDVSSCS